MQEKLTSEIDTINKKSITLALEIANNNAIINTFFDENSTNEDIKKNLESFLKNTSEDSVWIRLYDKNLDTKYKSWSDAKPYEQTFKRVDLEYTLKTKQPINLISSDEYTLSLKSLVPIITNGSLLGILEISNHFNTISERLKKYNISSVVLLNKKYSNELIKPITNIFLDDYYVANYDASSILVEYIKTTKLSNILAVPYHMDSRYISTIFELKDIKNETIGYYVMLKNIGTISNSNIDQFLLKSILILVILLLIVLLTIIYSMYRHNLKQKQFYKDMIHRSPNIAIIASKDEILEVNDTFFKYFSGFSSLEQFKKNHKTISEFFSKEGGYMCQDSEDFCWIEIVMQNIQENKVKLVIKESFYYFSISASLISEEDGLYYATFRDITKEELYKKELEETNITDTLTKIRNRYFYNIQLKKEASNANRYFYPLSLIIFDIDFFKKVNDVYGHDVGDKVLVEYSHLVGLHLRDSDIFCRIGGEEFAIILPHATKAGAYKLADKLRMIVLEHKVILPITMSFGVVEYKKGEDLELTFKRADEALYEAKRNGRNRVVVR